MKFNKGKYQLLHLGRNKPRHPYKLAEEQLCREGPGGPGGHNANHKPALCTCSNKGREQLVLH